MRSIIALLFIFSLSLQVEAKNLKVKSAMGTATFGGKSLKIGDEIPDGETIELDSNPETFVDLVYPEGHVLRLKKSASVRVSGNNLDLIRGQVFAYFAKDKGAEKIKIRTRSAVAGVRGTKYLIEEDEKKGTYICVCDGAVRIFSVEKPSDTPVIVKAGQDFWTKVKSQTWSSPEVSLGRPKNSPGMSEMTTAEFKSMGF